MANVSYKLKDLDRRIIKIGYVGENDHMHVMLDCKEAFDEYPNATVAMAITPPEGEDYPKTVTRMGNIVEWLVTNSDVAAEGDGEFQLKFTENNVIKKSVIGRFSVERSIQGRGTAPSGVQEWLTDAQETLDDLAAMDNIAKNAQAGDIGKALSPKTVEDGVVTEWEYITTGGGTEDYTDLENKPSIAGVTLSGDKTLEDLGIAAADDLDDVAEDVSRALTAIHGIAVTPEMFGAKGDGETDDTAAMQLAVDSGYEIKLADNKTYYLASVVNCDHDCHIVGGVNTVIKTESVTSGNETKLNTAFKFTRTLKKTTSLTSNYYVSGSYDNSANKFTLSDMDGIDVGDIMVIQATDQHYSYARPYFYLGAVLLISNIYEGRIYTTCDMPFGITNTENVTVRIYKAPEVTIENLTFVSDRAHIRYSYAIALYGCKNSIIRNCKIDKWWNAVLLQGCFNTLVDNVTVSNAKYDNSLFGDSYGVQLYGCTNTIIQRINSINAQGNIELTGQIVNLNTFIKNCNVSGECRAIGIDMHENAYNTVIEDCTLGGLSLFGTCYVSRCRIIRNNRVSNTDFGIVIRGSHNPDWARYRIVDCELIGANQFISINRPMPEEEIQSFENVFGNIELENIRGGFLMINPTITTTVTANVIKRLIVRNWQNCYEIYRTSYNVIDYMEVDSCDFAHSYWINNHSDAYSFSGIKLLRRTNNSPWTDNIYVDTKDHGRMYELPKGKNIVLSSSDSSAHYVVCGKNLASNNPSDIKIGGNSGSVGEANTFTVNTAFNNALSVNSDGQLVFTQPNNTSTSHIYPLYMFYAEKRSVVRISCKFKNIGSTNGANFGMYLCVVNALTGLIRWKERGTGVTATADGATAVQAVSVNPGEYVMGWIRCNTPVANSVTVFEDYYMMFRESDLSDPFVFEKYNGSNMDGDGTLTSVDGQNWIASSAETFNTTIKASMLS